MTAKQQRDSDAFKMNITFSISAFVSYSAFTHKKCVFTFVVELLRAKLLCVYILL